MMQNTSRHHAKPAKRLRLRNVVLISALFFAALNVYISMTYMLTKNPSSIVIVEKSGFEPPIDSSLGVAPFINQQHSSNTSKMTVLISTYNQTDCLHRLVHHLQTCNAVVDNIRINWFQPSPVPQSIANNTSFNIPVTFDVLPNNISHRFLPRDFNTDAVFSQDVDMSYSCEALQLAMDLWLNQTNQTHTAVGFFPRHLPSDKRYYKFDESHREPYKRNTVFITKGGLIHKNRFNDYFDPSLIPLRNHVDEHITAEDMLMSYVLASKEVKTITVCVPRSYWCNIRCNSEHESGQYESLGKRSKVHRSHLMVSFRDYFGSISMNEEHNPIIWHGGTEYGEDCNTEYNFCQNHEWMKWGMGRYREI